VQILFTLSIRFLIHLNANSIYNIPSSPYRFNRKFCLHSPFESLSIGVQILFKLSLKVLIHLNANSIYIIHWISYSFECKFYLLLFTVFLRVLIDLGANSIYIIPSSPYRFNRKLYLHYPSQCEYSSEVRSRKARLRP
jgi:hypothetical protein